MKSTGDRTKEIEQRMIMLWPRQVGHEICSPQIISRKNIGLIAVCTPIQLARVPTSAITTLTDSDSCSLALVGTPALISYKLVLHENYLAHLLTNYARSDVQFLGPGGPQSMHTLH